MSHLFNMIKVQGLGQVLHSVDRIQFTVLYFDHFHVVVDHIK